MTQQAAFQFLYEHKAIAFLKDCYEIEHTLSFDDAVEDMERICADTPHSLFYKRLSKAGKPMLHYSAVFRYLRNTIKKAASWTMKVMTHETR